MAKFATNIMAGMQQLGRTLMLPIAVLPIAGLLLRFGQPDMMDIPFVSAAGGAIFANLGLLFAIGVAVGFAKENHGAAGLAGLVGYLVAANGVKTLIDVPPEVFQSFSENAQGLAQAAFKDQEISKLSVPIGIISGLIAGFLYNRYNDIKLPEFLAFFGGRRFVPIASGCAGVVVAAVFGFGWTHIEGAMDLFSRSVVGAGDAGLFVFGVLNRILIVTGLHHILNNVAWFIIGDYNGVTGDLNRFFAGDTTAGSFMTGFFPVMMFGLPAACFAMYRSALPDRRKEVGGMLLSLGLTSFLTGVTEPIEFTFMFLAPALFALHALLTGISMALMDILNVKLGFSFSAGLIDYLLNFGKSTRPLLLIPIGVAYALIYYFVFRFFIVAMNLKTPGRDVAELEPQSANLNADEKALSFISALGGAENLNSVDACTTRLRLVVGDNSIINEAALTGLGARGVIRPSATALQVVVGPIADQLSSEIKRALLICDKKALRVVPPPAPKKTDARATGGLAETSQLSNDGVRNILAALGGGANVVEVKAASSRVLVRLKDDSIVDDKKLLELGVRGVSRPIIGALHLLIGPAAEQTSASLNGILA